MVTVVKPWLIFVSVNCVLNFRLLTVQNISIPNAIEGVLVIFCLFFVLKDQGEFS